jgi:hypothetical protein
MNMTWLKTMLPDTVDNPIFRGARETNHGCYGLSESFLVEGYPTPLDHPRKGNTPIKDDGDRRVASSQSSTGFTVTHLCMIPSLGPGYLRSAISCKFAVIDKKWMSGWSAATTFEGEYSNVSSSYAGKGVVRKHGWSDESAQPLTEADIWRYNPAAS